MKPVHVAAVNGHFDIMEFLIENKTDLTPKKKPQEIFTAAYSNDIQSLMFLVESGFDVNSQDSEGWDWHFPSCSALYYAASYGHVGLSRYLLYRKANVCDHNDMVYFKVMICHLFMKQHYRASIIW